ncbi:MULTISPECIES: restriction endonuclease [Bacillus cereus group]|uniref:Mrr-like domain-containing protein n=4 Tax=Bacillus TaxID=1386 RepID=A0A0J1HX07_BACAN|nr:MULTISPECIES: restriction endonuclease [Bacillus cereus group]EOQ19582.1 hypothetical protein IKC_04056 [Bacillus cereus VD184]KLV18261.1 hypothetical protein ABW01_12820 [Bacillus anthracis]MCC3686981.1 restriction endonuclease [Bacillus cereus]OUB76818.1 hypothetical protein BK750_02795 [Bacillus thuringiensis serovar jegathesan]
MERDFSWLWDNLKEGARDKFEEICYDIYSNEYPDADVHRVKVTQGDGGIDVFIDEENGDYTIIQCKFFLNGLNDGRKNQIRDSFKTAVEKNSMDKWILCIPMDLSNEEHTWWKNWKEKQKDKGIFIRLHDESKLMKLVRKHNLYDEYFNTLRVDQNFFNDVNRSDEKSKIHDRLYPLISAILNGDYDVYNIIRIVDSLMDLKAHRLFKGNYLLDYLEELSQLYSIHAEGNNIYGRMIKDDKRIKEETQLRIKIRDEYKKLNL